MRPLVGSTVGSSPPLRSLVRRASPVPSAWITNRLLAGTESASASCGKRVLAKHTRPSGSQHGSKSS
jgi:hypothetical protein